jgi:hypothetical protein
LRADNLKITPANWRDLQHYKDRSPPWIRLHRKLLDNYDFHCLPVASRALAPMLWLIASEGVDGVIDADPGRLAFRLRVSAQDITDALTPLIQAKFFFVQHYDSDALAPCLHDVLPEAEAEAETLQREIPASPAPAPKARKPQKTALPEDFGISERVRKWAAAKGYGQLDEHLEAFKRKSVAKGYTNVSWDDAFMEAIREDWAKLRGRAANGAAPPPDTKTGPSEADKTAAYLAAQKPPQMTAEQRAATAERLRQARAAIGRVQ